MVIFMRYEVLIFVLVTLAFLSSWLFVPIYTVYGPNVLIQLTPLGYVIHVLKVSYTLTPLTLYLVPAYAIASIIVPLVWKKTRYSLYVSAVLAGLSLTMFLSTVLYLWRYIIVEGYIATPTPDGVTYVFLPKTWSLDFPAYLLFASAILSAVNALTRARWIIPQKGKGIYIDLSNGIIPAIEMILDKLDIPYTKVGNEIDVNGLKIREFNDKVVIITPNNVFEYKSKEEGFRNYFPHLFSYISANGVRGFEDYELD